MEASETTARSTGAHSREGTFAARGRAGVAGAPPVTQQVDVQLELLARLGEREHLVVELLEGRPRAQQAQARADARDVRVDGDVVAAVGEQQHAGGRLAADAR